MRQEVAIMSMLEEHPHLIRLKQVLYAPQRLYLVTGGYMLSRQACPYSVILTGLLHTSSCTAHFFMYCTLLHALCLHFTSLASLCCVSSCRTWQLVLSCVLELAIVPGPIHAAFASIITWELRALTRQASVQVQITALLSCCLTSISHLAG